MMDFDRKDLELRFIRFLTEIVANHRSTLHTISISSPLTLQLSNFLSITHTHKTINQQPKTQLSNLSYNHQPRKNNVRFLDWSYCW